MAFTGRVALVTGGASGMGRISARRLADGGAQVAILDVNEEGLAETAAGRPGLHPFRCDLADPDQVTEVVAKVTADLGPIERVTHAAAIMPTAPAIEMPADLTRTLMRVNYEGTVTLAAATLPSMFERRRGDFIVFGSIAGTVPTFHMAAYCATKAAVNMWTEILIRENEGRGVRIILVCPPMVDTPLLKQATESSNPRSIQLGIEQNRLADPELIVDAIEEGLERGVRVLHPTVDAKVLVGLRRFIPDLLWKLVVKAENS